MNRNLTPVRSPQVLEIILSEMYVLGKDDRRLQRKGGRETGPEDRRPQRKGGRTGETKGRERERERETDRPLL